MISSKLMEDANKMNSVIGGADGPTSIFLAGKLGCNWINFFGLIIVVLLLLPNILYAFYFRRQKK